VIMGLGVLLQVLVLSLASANSMPNAYTVSPVVSDLATIRPERGSGEALRVTMMSWCSLPAGKWTVWVAHESLGGESSTKRVGGASVAQHLPAPQTGSQRL
jgi:hypothetical protein